MKKIFLLFGLILVVILLVGANLRKEKESMPGIPTEKKPCYGYTIIEYGVGINCHGDTVKLSKVQGGQVWLAETETAR